jgi:succinate dehydrogenase/fumarate reductase flavoprotein subunit
VDRKSNTEARGISEEGELIQEFFAAGEVTGSIHGANRHNGNSIFKTITFARIADKNAVKFAKQMAGNIQKKTAVPKP